MKNSITGYKDDEVISEYIEGRDKLIVYNLKGKKLPNYTDVDSVTEEMINQAEAYISDIKEVEKKALKMTSFSLFIFIMTIVGFILTVVGAVTLLLFSVPASLVALAGFIVTLAVYEKYVSNYLAKTSEVIELHQDKLKYKVFLDDLEKVNDYQELSHDDAMVTINDIDNLTDDQIKAKLRCMATHLRFIKHDLEAKEKSKTKHLKIVK